MPIKYKIDVLEALKAAGYSTYRLRKDKLIGEATIQWIRSGEPVLYVQSHQRQLLTVEPD